MGLKKFVKDTKMKVDVLYLLEQYNKTSGLFILNNKYVFIEKNLHNYKADGIETEFLTLKTSINIESIGNDPSFKKGNYNLIIFESEETDSEMENFFKLCKLYSKNNDYNFKDFFTSLYNIFQSKKHEKSLNLIGFWGELYILCFLRDELNIDGIKYWHVNSMDKYDFVFPNMPLEIKTTNSKEKLLSIKHDQIFNNQTKILGAVFVENNNSGDSILDLITKLNKDKVIAENIDFQLKLQQEIVKLSVTDLSSCKFILNELKFFISSKLPSIKFIPDNITEIQYKYSCDNLQGILKSELVKLLK